MARLELNHRQSKRKYLGDLYLFDKEILGYSQMEEQPHRLMCDSVQNGGRRQLDLWPRGHFKSSCITVGETIRQIGLNPNIRVFIGNVVLSNAQSFLREIKGHLEHNEKLRELIGDQVSRNEKKWTDTQIEIKGRNQNLKEPTIQVSGVGQSLASQHYDLMILDDLVDVNSVNTREQIEKTIAWYKMCLSLLEPDGTLIIIGTRYHHADLYGYLIANHSDKFKPEVHAVYDDQGQPIFPSRFPTAVIDELRKDQGSYIFSCNYLNNPVDDESAKFKKSNILYYEDKDIETKQVYTTMTVDRAYSLNKTADFTGIVIRSVDQENKWYIRYAKRHKASEGEIIKSIFDLRSYFKADKVGIEQLAFNDTFKPVLEEEMRRRDDFFTIDELKGRTSKIARIEALIPRFEAHSIYIKSDMTDLEDELLRFPSAEHDDLADALAYQNDLTVGLNQEPVIIGYEDGLGGIQIPVYSFN